MTLNVFASTLFWTEMFIFSSRKYIIYISFCFCCAVTCICICWDWPRNILCWWELITFLFYTRNNLIMVIYDSICLFEYQANKGHEIRPTSFTSPHITFFSYFSNGSYWKILGKRGWEYTHYHFVHGDSVDYMGNWYPLSVNDTDQLFKLPGHLSTLQ